MDQIFSATGCMRCNIVKAYMKMNQMAYEEQDIHADGKEVFKVFYRENRPHIFRGEEGVEFPILYAGKKIYQGVGVILAHLMAGNRLEGFVTRSDLSHGRISGLNVSAGPAREGPAFLSLLRFLKEQGLMIQLEADGRNSMLLETILKGNLIHDLVFYLRGPADLYEPLTGTALTTEELSHGLSLLNLCSEYKIILPVSYLPQKDGSADWLSPQEAARAAALVETATGSKKHPFFITATALSGEMNIAQMQPSELFKYRTLCRRYMVLCDIIKS